jgi:hypothetical protein
MEAVPIGDVLYKMQQYAKSHSAKARSDTDPDRYCYGR